MNIETPFIVLSSDRAQYHEELNAARRDTFEHQLRARGLDFKRVIGAYKGASEVSYIVLVPTTGDEQNAVRLARRYGQESVLLVDANRYASLIYLNEGEGGISIKEIKGIGFWRETTESDATAGDAYTRDGDRYYTTRALP